MSPYVVGRVCLIGCVLGGNLGRAQVETPVPSAQFVDSIGINVHLGYTNTLYYTNFPLIQSSLAGLWINHVRDNAPLAAPAGFYSNHSALLASGIRGLFSAGITFQPSDVANYPALFAAGYFEGFEPPNECDVSLLCGTPWVGNLTGFLPMLNANSGAFPVLGPSFANPLGPPAVGDVSASSDFGNIHDYKGGWNPGFAGSWGYGYVNYLSDALSVSLAGITNPNQPVISTETGYTNAIATQATQVGYPAGTIMPYDANSVSEANAATYVPRIPLMAWLDGIQRTYIYELLSSPGQDYGLLRGDGSQKPAYLALSKMTSLFRDHGGAFAVDPIALSITGGDATVRHLLLEKSNHTYHLVIWLESSVYNKFTNTATPVPSQNVIVTVGPQMLSLVSYAWHNTGMVTKQTLPPGPVTVSVGPDITVLAFNVQR